MSAGENVDFKHKASFLCLLMNNCNLRMKAQQLFFFLCLVHFGALPLPAGLEEGWHNFQCYTSLGCEIIGSMLSSFIAKGGIKGPCILNVRSKIKCSLTQ